ncbi:hypothetical protein FGO68_gene11685 [Halteria grandinella]|uniref:Uncharacterized protein n=1 Tax=Halteria grandinella TaxID=5974 RepID=A0A8J8P7M9_HALGN|nr:hypothetical protein FGO68_gene11685 [Halteria grandinella]
MALEARCLLITYRHHQLINCPYYFNLYRVQFNEINNKELYSHCCLILIKRFYWDYNIQLLQRRHYIILELTITPTLSLSQPPNLNHHKSQYVNLTLITRFNSIKHQQAYVSEHFSIVTEYQTDNIGDKKAKTIVVTRIISPNPHQIQTPYHNNYSISRQQIYKQD